jgi:hypothetical protein
MLLVRDSRDEPVVIEEIKTDHPAIHCKWAEGPGKAAPIRVQLDPTALKETELHSAVHIRLSRPAGAVLTVPVICHAN